MSDLRARREAVVREHMESENRHDFAATMATFAHPRYELMASGQVYDGVDEVNEYFRSSRAAYSPANPPPLTTTRCGAGRFSMHQF